MTGSTPSPVDRQVQKLIDQVGSELFGEIHRIGFIDGATAALKQIHREHDAIVAKTLAAYIATPQFPNSYRRKSQLDEPVGMLDGLSERTYSVLEQSGIETINDLLSADKQDLQVQSEQLEEVFNELKEALAQIGWYRNDWEPTSTFPDNRDEVAVTQAPPDTPLKVVLAGKRPFQMLDREGLRTIGDLMEALERDPIVLFDIKGFGPVSISKLQSGLARFGYSLPDVYFDTSGS